MSSEITTARVVTRTTQQVVHLHVTGVPPVASQLDDWPVRVEHMSVTWEWSDSGGTWTMTAMQLGGRRIPDGNGSTDTSGLPRDEPRVRDVLDWEGQPRTAAPAWAVEIADAYPPTLAEQFIPGRLA